MNTLLKKFQLTEEARKASIIHIPKNALGDPAFRRSVNAITDADASELLLRRDGRGRRFVEAVPSPKAATPSEKSV